MAVTVMSLGQSEFVCASACTGMFRCDCIRICLCVNPFPRLYHPSLTCRPTCLLQWERPHTVECLLPFKLHYYLLLPYSPCPLLPGVHIG